MRYLDKDVAHLLHGSPYLTLAKPRGAVRLLQREVEIGERWVATLRQFPAVRVEPLEFHYRCLRNLGALDPTFFEMLVGDHGWRGVVWGSFLAMLEPRARFLGPLQRELGRWPINDWIVEHAVATLEGRAPREHEDVVALVARLREVLHGVPRPAIPLRCAPTAAQMEQMRHEQEHIRTVYAEEGTDAALAAIPGTLMGYYVQDYLRWARAGAAPPPRGWTGLVSLSLEDT
ncbi:Hypothetical protein A7982_11139 [Minicystis rosea]|nr:Hypothetical protein A7982_11139 [Minicystis rosea]